MGVMNIQRRIHPTVAIIAFLTVSCSSKENYTPPRKVEQEKGTWDYSKIREIRESEKVQNPDKPQNTEPESCVLMSASQMKRAKVSGCRKADARAGEGEGEESYCCPR